MCRFLAWRDHVAYPLYCWSVVRWFPCAAPDVSACVSLWTYALFLDRCLGVACAARAPSSDLWESPLAYVLTHT